MVVMALLSRHGGSTPFTERHAGYGQGKASEDQTASRLTVLLALAMNALIAAAKLVVGAVSGSSAMLAEGAHSVADTVNEVFLLTSLRRSSRPPDSKHPFGYGAERFFWSLLAAIGIFLSGAVFSAYQAFHALTESGSGQHSYIWSYAELGLAFVAEGVSWVRSVIQLRGEAKAAGHGFFDHLRRTRDPTVKTVFSETRPHWSASASPRPRSACTKRPGTSAGTRWVRP